MVLFWRSLCFSASARIPWATSQLREASAGYAVSTFKKKPKKKRPSLNEWVIRGKVGPASSQIPSHGHEDSLLIPMDGEGYGNTRPPKRRKNSSTRPKAQSPYSAIPVLQPGAPLVEDLDRVHDNGTDEMFPWSGDLKREALAKWGTSNFRPFQLETLNAVMMGKDVFCVLPTGSGKSLCYQLPAILSGGVSCVISPLVSLMEDQQMAMQAMNLPCISLAGSGTDKIKEARRAAVENKHLVVLLTPEKLVKSLSLRQLVRDWIETGQLTRWVFDEVHTVEEFADFRPDYARMSEFIRTVSPNVQKLAFTATAAPSLRRKLATSLGMQQENTDFIISSLVRANLYFGVHEKASQRADAILQVANYISHLPSSASGIIYCLTKRETDEVCRVLRTSYGVSAVPYHSDLSALERTNSHQAWMRGSAQVMCATTAFGMGIHKDDVRFVLHFSLPLSMESYYQQAGRAGRDGLPAQCVMLFSRNDRVRALKVADASFLKRGPYVDTDRIVDVDVQDRRIEQVDDVVNYAATGTKPVCRRKVLVSFFGETLLKPCGYCDVCAPKLCASS